MINLENVFLVSTDTIIGIGIPIKFNDEEILFKLKKRNKTKKIIISISDLDQLKKLENINEKHLFYIEKCWPGSTTLIINGNAYRMPNCNKLLKLISELGPIYLTSANISGKNHSQSMEEAKKEFPQIKKVYNFCKGTNIPSTIINTENGEILR